MSVNQRFIKAFDYLKVKGLVKNQITFYETIGIDKARFSYLYRDPKASTLKPEEQKALIANFPEINWNDYVNLGIEPMLASEDKNVLKEDAAEYLSKQWYQEQLNLIVAGASKLPAQEQLKILRAAFVEKSNQLVEANQLIVKLQQAGQTTLLDEIKNMLKGK